MAIPDFVVIPCRGCDATTIALAERPRPLMCARCGVAYDPATGAFSRAPDTTLVSLEPRMPSDEPPLVM